MGNIERLITKLVTNGLRLAVIAYIFTAIYPFMIDPGFESTFGSWSVRWLLIILMGAVALTVFILQRSNFLVYGFFAVLIVAIFQLFVSLTNDRSITDLLLHFYALATASYFITRDFRVHAHSHGRRRKKD